MRRAMARLASKLLDRPRSRRPRMSADPAEQDPDDGAAEGVVELLDESEGTLAGSPRRPSRSGGVLRELGEGERRERERLAETCRPLVLKYSTHSAVAPAAIEASGRLPVAAMEFS